MAIDGERIPVTSEESVQRLESMLEEHRDIVGASIELEKARLVAAVSVIEALLNAKLDDDDKQLGPKSVQLYNAAQAFLMDQFRLETGGAP